MSLMYIPEPFALDAEHTAHFLATVVAGDLVTATDDGLVATFLPLLLDLDRGRNGSLLGHLARNNTQWKRPVHGEALVIAHGPDAYVSPSWYPSTAEHGRVVPTWDYSAAHVYGNLVIHDDEAWLDSAGAQAHASAMSRVGRTRGRLTMLPRSTSPVSSGPSLVWSWRSRGWRCR